MLHADRRPGTAAIDDQVIITAKRYFHTCNEWFSPKVVTQLPGDPVDPFIGESDCFGHSALGWRRDQNFPGHRINFYDQSFGAAIDPGDHWHAALADIDFGSGNVIYGHDYTMIKRWASKDASSPVSPKDQSCLAQDGKINTRQLRLN